MNMRMAQPVDGAAWSVHRAIVEQAQDAVIFADREGIIRLWNRGAEVIFGYTAAEVLGHSLDVIIPAGSRSAHGHGFRQAVSSGLSRFDGRVMTTRANHKFGSRLYVDMSLGLLKDGHGEVAGAYAVARDCTARHMEEVAHRALAGSMPVRAA
jgi:PAS domain S-box-containing protein